MLADGELDADQVVVALPSRLAAAVLAPCDGELSRASSSPSNTPRRRRCASRTSARRSPTPSTPSGFLVPRSEGRRITAGTFISSKWPGPRAGGLRAPCARSSEARTTKRPPRSKTAISSRSCRASSKRLLGIQGAPHFAKVFRYPKASPQPLVGHADRVAHIRARIETLPGLHVIGNAYDGVGIPDCVRLAEQTAAQIRSVRGIGRAFLDAASPLVDAPSASTRCTQ